MMECACVCVHVCRFLWRVMEESALMCLGYTYESWQQWCHGSTTSTCPPCVWEKKGKSKRETVCVRLSIRSQEIADGQWGGSLSYCLYMCVLGLAARIEFNRCTARHISSLVLFSLLFLYIHLSFHSSIGTKPNFFSFMELQHSSRHEELHQTGWPSLLDQPLSEKKTGVWPAQWFCPTFTVLVSCNQEHKVKRWSQQIQLLT